MNQIVRWGILGFVFYVQAVSMALGAESHDVVTLKQCYDASVLQSEIIAGQTELIEQADERYAQAKGSLLPSVSALATYLRQENPSSSIGSSVSPSEQTTIRLSGTQSIFKGFREIAKLKQQSTLLESQRWAHKYARIQLYDDVVLNFYQILSAEDEIQDLNIELSLNEKRLSELKERQRIGRSRSSEVLSVEASIATAKSKISAAQSSVSTLRETFHFLTGFPKWRKLKDELLEHPKIAPMGELLSAVDKRADVQSQLARTESADAAVGYARGGHWPSVDLAGNYYFKRPGALSTVNWDVQLIGTFPIFQGGVTQSQLREAVSVRRQVEKEAQRTRRLAEQEIKTAYQNYKYDIEQIQNLANAARLSELNYKGVLRDYRLGLVTNLEVLQSLTTSREAQRALVRMQYSAKIDYLKVQNSSLRIETLNQDY